MKLKVQKVEYHLAIGQNLCKQHQTPCILSPYYALTNPTHHHVTIFAME